MPPKKIPVVDSNGAGPSGTQHVAKKPAGKVVTARGYKRPEALPLDYLIEDKINKRSWRIGDLIGQGGFADVYAVSDHISKPVSLATAKHVLKLEPGSNGPLFQEIRFFKAAAKKDSIATFLVSHKLKSLGMMEYVASGVLEFNDKELRWLVIPRLGKGVQTILEESGGRFSRQSVILLALQLIDILEYIHSQGYAHGDIKAGNMMTGLSKTESSQVYLIDFGLVKKFVVDGVHNPMKEEPKAAHDGTLEFTSVDAHKGIPPSRRGDLQILGFNLIRWSIGSLPWSDSHDANFVKTQKIAYLQNLTEFFRVAFPAGEAAPKELVDYFKEIKSLEYDSKPNYSKLRTIFETASKDVKVRKSDLFQATIAVDSASTVPANPTKRKANGSVVDVSNDVDVRAKKSVTAPASPKKRGRKPATTSAATTNGSVSDDSETVVKKAVTAPASPKKRSKKAAAVVAVQDDLSDDDTEVTVKKSITAPASPKKRVRKPTSRKAAPVVDVSDDGDSEDAPKKPRVAAKAARNKMRNTDI